MSSSPTVVTIELSLTSVNDVYERRDIVSDPVCDKFGIYWSLKVVCDHFDDTIRFSLQPSTELPLRCVIRPEISLSCDGQTYWTRKVDDYIADAGSRGPETSISIEHLSSRELQDTQDLWVTASITILAPPQTGFISPFNEFNAAHALGQTWVKLVGLDNAGHCILLWWNRDKNCLNTATVDFSSQTWRQVGGEIVPQGDGRKLDTSLGPDRCFNGSLASDSKILMLLFRECDIDGSKPTVTLCAMGGHGMEVSARVTIALDIGIAPLPSEIACTAQGLVWARDGRLELVAPDGSLHLLTNVPDNTRRLVVAHHAIFALYENACVLGVWQYDSPGWEKLNHTPNPWPTAWHDLLPSSSMPDMPLVWSASANTVSTVHVRDSGECSVVNAGPFCILPTHGPEIGEKALVTGCRMAWLGGITGMVLSMAHINCAEEVPSLKVMTSWRLRQLGVWESGARKALRLASTAPQITSC